MLYIVSKVNATEWFVHGRTILLAPHHNGSTTPPACDKMAKNQTEWQLDRMLRNIHMTMQLQMCF